MQLVFEVVVFGGANDVHRGEGFHSLFGTGLFHLLAGLGKREFGSKLGFPDFLLGNGSTGDDTGKEFMSGFDAFETASFRCWLLRLWHKLMPFTWQRGFVSLDP